MTSSGWNNAVGQLHVGEYINADVVLNDESIHRGHDDWYAEERPRARVQVQRPMTIEPEDDSHVTEWAETEGASRDRFHYEGRVEMALDNYRRAENQPITSEKIKYRWYADNVADKLPPPDVRARAAGGYIEPNPWMELPKGVVHNMTVTHIPTRQVRKRMLNWWEE